MFFEKAQINIKVHASNDFSTVKKTAYVCGHLGFFYQMIERSWAVNSTTLGCNLAQFKTGQEAALLTCLLGRADCFAATTEEEMTRGFMENKDAILIFNCLYQPLPQGNNYFVLSPNNKFAPSQTYFDNLVQRVQVILHIVKASCPELFS